MKGHNGRSKIGPSVPQTLLYEDTDHPRLPQVKLDTENDWLKSEPACATQDQWYLRGWDISPLEGTLSHPQLNVLSHGHSTKANLCAYIHQTQLDIYLEYSAYVCLEYKFHEHETLSRLIAISELIQIQDCIWAEVSYQRTNQAELEWSYKSWCF